MIQISASAKEAIIKKALSKNGQTLLEIATASNISLSSLKRWLTTCKAGKKSFSHNGKTSEVVTLPERFKHLQATFGQDDVTLGAYCRQHGLYPHQLTQWESEFMTNPALIKNPALNSELKELRTENKLLKQLIIRKDKVLAETVALLVLKKKAAQIWGVDEED